MSDSNGTARSDNIDAEYKAALARVEQNYLEQVSKITADHEAGLRRIDFMERASYFIVGLGVGGMIVSLFLRVFEALQ